MSDHDFDKVVNASSLALSVNSVFVNVVEENVVLGGSDTIRKKIQTASSNAIKSSLLYWGDLDAIVLTLFLISIFRLNFIFVNV